MFEKKKLKYSDDELLSSLRHQAVNGGHKTEALGGDGNGPYWPRAAWEKFCLRTKQFLIDDCGYDEPRAEAAVQANSAGVILIDGVED